MKNKPEKCFVIKDKEHAVSIGGKKMPIFFTFLLITLAFYQTSVSAQSTLNVTGGNSSGNGGSVSYSVGQIFYETHAGNSGTVANGVQQPFEISIVTAIENTNGIALSMSVYPNPTTDYLTLEVKGFDLSALQYQLYDMNGRLLQSKLLTETPTQIDMGGLNPATYFLKVMVGAQDAVFLKEVKSFKIIKTQ